MAAEPTVRSEVHYEGRVQGVGFRYTTQTAAGSHEVAGYVQNLPDGRVRVVVEGATDEVDAFLQDVSRRMEGYIQNQVRRDSPATGEFTRFEVRHA